MKPFRRLLVSLTVSSLILSASVVPAFAAEKPESTISHPAPIVHIGDGIIEASQKSFIHLNKQVMRIKNEQVISITPLSDKDMHQDLVNKISNSDKSKVNTIKDTTIDKSQSNTSPLQTPATESTQPYSEITFQPLISMSGDGYIDLGFQITNILGTPPASVHYDLVLANSTSQNGAYSEYDNSASTLSQIYVGKQIYTEFPVFSSYYWDFAIGLVSFDSEGAPYLPAPIEGEYNLGLANGKGLSYPVYTDSLQGKVMSKPQYSNYLPVGNKVSWTSTDRQNYINWYTQWYGTPSGGWTQYDIHHILPRQFGGTNDYSNLMPLPKWYHQQTVTPWWSNYSPYSYSDLTTWGDD
ncbi:HNH endonuclease signature motif containing protein [Paenibacillus sp. SI8]|uniref:HNH endonuclease signature motif containing protein n=1 Tax=unclassified Paenibacillus TaxID=185978 RepID=UPI00346522D9